MYLPGDIVGVISNNLFSKLQHQFITPQTNLYHFFLIARPCQFEDDYEIYESIGKGVAVGRLSWYSETPYVVFRIKDPDIEALGRRAVEFASKFGRSYYDFLLYPKLFFGVLKCWYTQLTKEKRIRLISPYELPYARDSQFICTEFVNEVWRSVGRPLIPEGVVPIPASIVKAFLDNKLIIVGQNNVG